MIKILPPHEAKLIAAGEVIDRPAALIREFLDNAIDSGAENIEVSIEGGGGKKTEVVDDGSGMSREDLELCWQTHATSKIRCLDDLEACESLGFRGEALAAAAAVSQLEIISSTDGREAWKLETGPGENPPQINRNRRTKGTTVRATDLFAAIPARRRFLKRDGSEAAMCRQAFIDKALAFPCINFRFSQDGKAKYFLPAAASKKERFAAALLENREKSFLHEIHAAGNGFTATVVIGGPELYRSDKRMLYVFANGRRIQDYSLIQALVYGTQGLFPNGTAPIGAVYIDIDPALADFNIHPAKREARFRDPGAIHHAVTSGLREFFRHVNLKAASENQREEHSDLFTYNPGQSAGTFRPAYTSPPAALSGAPPSAAPSSDGQALAMQALLENPLDFAPLPGHSKSGNTAGEPSPVYETPHYAGRAFSLFILVEWGDKLFIIDQHAAHERILYDRFLSGPIPTQDLLVPIPFAGESEDDDRFLETKQGELAKLGLIIERDGAGWRIDALPADWQLGDAETVREILNLRKAGKDFTGHWVAAICRSSAVREGDYLDEKSALALAEEALRLPDPRCPHGRPIWTEISREALYKAVRRI